jgi:hypothetical protein
MQPELQVCLKHRGWIGDCTSPSLWPLDTGQTDITALPEVLTAARRLRRLAAQHGSALRHAFNHANLQIRARLKSHDDPPR